MDLRSGKMSESACVVRLGGIRTVQTIYFLGGWEGGAAATTLQNLRLSSFVAATPIMMVLSGFLQSNKLCLQLYDVFFI